MAKIKLTGWQVMAIEELVDAAANGKPMPMSLETLSAQLNRTVSVTLAITTPEKVSA